MLIRLGVGIWVLHVLEGLAMEGPGLGHRDTVRPFLTTPLPTAVQAGGIRERDTIKDNSRWGFSSGRTGRQPGERAWTAR